MKMYLSHKVVQAAKISAVKKMQDGGYQLQLEDHEITDVPENFYARGGPFEDDLGYLMVYADGYQSWTPTKPFEDGYTGIRSRMDFGTALNSLKNGRRVQRAGWNGQGMWLELQSPDERSKMTLPYLYLNYPDDAKNTPGAVVPWLASQTDMLANDWMMVS